MSRRGTQSFGGELREQGRAIIGALVVLGITALYTMETWWLGWRLPLRHLIVYDLAGLGLVLAVTRNVSFRAKDREQNGGGRNHVLTTVTDFAELVLQSFVAAYFVFLLFGVIGLGEPLTIVARLGLIAVVPLAFGAALTNQLLRGNDDSEPKSFPRQLATFAVGAIFLSGTMAPTEEMELIATYIDWYRAVAFVLLTLFTSYVMLYELGLRGQDRRIRSRTKLWQFGHAALVYTIGILVSAALLYAFGHFAETSFAIRARMTIILALPASVGAGAAQVII